MKVSAPVVPIPDAPPAAPVEAAAPGTTEATEAPPADTAPVVELATWPEWFKPVDIALCILVAVLAFLISSYTARNRDIWRHMATGRLIVEGKHPIGGDPLSFSAADRPWVNSNWIFDVVMYASYSADDSGTVSVVLKSLAFAGSFALLFLLRKPEQSLWPWAALATLGVLACGSLASLRPHVFGMLLESVVLVLLFRGNWSGPKWRMPAIFGAVCWVWACTDSFFLLGPVTAGLVLLGEYLQTKFVGTQNPDASNDSFWPAPPREALIRGALCAVAGILLNPMFLGAVVRGPVEAVEQLIPFELTTGWGDIFSGDDHLTSITLSPLSAPYFDKTERGDNLTGYSAIALVVVGGILLVVGSARLRATHIALWLAFVLLALLHYRFIPVACLLAFPLAAAHLNGLSRFRLQGRFDPRTKMVLNLCGIGRIISVTALILLIGATVPGYLHPKEAAVAAYNRRLSWGIEEETGLSRGAKLIEQWRSDGDLPAESHAMLSHFDFGDYCAWFAPRERVFINSRFRFHGRELVDLATIRRELRSKEKDNTKSDSAPLKDLADKYGADLYVLGQWNQRVRLEEFLRLQADFSRGPKRSPTALLHLDGRVSILCRTDTLSGLEASKKIIYSPEREAFAPGGALVPSGKSVPQLVPLEGWTADFIAAPQPGSVFTDDAIIFTLIANEESIQSQQAWFFQKQQALIGSWAAGATLGFAIDPGPRKPSGAELAYPILANRAARRAIADTPDDPEPYRALSETYALGYLGTQNPKESELQQLTGLRRYLDRLAVSPNKNELLNKLSLRDEFTLFLLHLRSSHYDLALDLLTKANGRIKTAADGDLPPPEQMKAWSDQYRALTVEHQYVLPPGILNGISGDAALAEAMTNSVLQRAVSEGQRPTNEDAQRIYKSISAELATTTLDPPEKKDKAKPRDVDWIRARSQLLEDRLKREVGRRTELAQQGGGKSLMLAAKFLQATRNGLIGRATDLVSNQTEWEALAASELTIPANDRALMEVVSRYPILLVTAKPQIDPKTDRPVGYVLTDIGLYLQMIEFQLVSGKLDMAVLNLSSIVEKLQKLEKETPGSALLAKCNRVIKQLRLLQYRLEGNTDLLSEELREQLREFPKWPAATLEGVKIPIDTLATPLGAVTGMVPTILDPFSQPRAALVQEASLYFELGMTALLAGDNAEARSRFAMVAKPQGVPIANLNVNLDGQMVGFAQQYTLMLDRNAAKPKR